MKIKSIVFEKDEHPLLHPDVLSKSFYAEFPEGVAPWQAYWAVVEIYSSVKENQDK